MDGLSLPLVLMNGVLCLVAAVALDQSRTAHVFISPCC